MPDNSVQMSQGYDVIQPRRGRAYPILCEEWEHLKGRVRKIKTSLGLYHTLGSVILGGGLSTFISIVSGAYTASAKQDPSIMVIAWAATISCTLIGILCLRFAKESSTHASDQAEEVAQQMELIEARYLAEDVG